MSTSNLRKAIKDYFAAHLRVPLKLTDEWREGQWVWERNKPARKTHWGVNKPSRSRLKNCAFMSARGDWADDPCDLASDFHICQRQMKHGPSDVEIDVKWSRSPNYVQENSTFLANCSVFYPFLGKITWVLHDKQNMTKLDDLHGNITLFQEPAYMADGTCGQKTTSTISFKVGLQHHGLRFSCFGYSDVNLPKKMCTQKGKPFKYCDISKQITVIEKPRDVKMGRILFHAPPSTLYTGQKVSFGCTAMEPRNSQLAWRVDGVSLNLQQLRGKKTSFVELTERPGKNVGETHSWISFFVREEHDGMVISCHDYSSISQPGECTHQRRRLTYCDVSPRIAVIADGPRGPPILSLDCDGYPGEIHADSKVTASCNVTHGGSGTLIWVAYFREGPKAFTYNDTDRKYLRPHTEVHKNSPANATVLLSELDFTMSLALSGLRIGCFAYDIRNYRPDTLECWDGEYCVVSKKLTVQIRKRCYLEGKSVTGMGPTAVGPNTRSIAVSPGLDLAPIHPNIGSIAVRPNTRSIAV
ncbi:hypothetical protein RRG08_062010 [Elysia crispata]|uniref:C-type lectin domain-containing protein n=1 Tax=Elysia crispata TaxID=231223 RepID=A0AAE1DRN9_9GAST|nr:hypothetical protein RRG08_062010 [Elysia crispata]